MSERQRLINLSARLQVARTELQQKKPVALCNKCGHESFLFDFSRPVTVKTCKNVECKAVKVVEGV